MTDLDDDRDRADDPAGFGVSDEFDDPAELMLPALEIRTPELTVVVLEGPGDGWIVVKGSADLADAKEEPIEHPSFADAIRRVSDLVEPHASSIPIAEFDDLLEPVAIFDAEGGVFVIDKVAQDDYRFRWVDDDGEVEDLARFDTLEDALTLPILDEEVLGER